MKNINIHYHPLIPEHRIQALLQAYDSEEDECPFYVETERHFCLLDYYSIHVENCLGRCFDKGFCCEIINSLLFNLNSDQNSEPNSDAP